jgi:hypothetical protein
MQVIQNCKVQISVIHIIGFNTRTEVFNVLSMSPVFGSLSPFPTLEIVENTIALFPDSPFPDVEFIVDAGITLTSAFMKPNDANLFPEFFKEGMYYLTVDIPDPATSPIPKHAKTFTLTILPTVDVQQLTWPVRTSPGSHWADDMDTVDIGYLVSESESELELQSQSLSYSQSFIPQTDEQTVDDIYFQKDNKGGASTSTTSYVDMLTAGHNEKRKASDDIVR